MGLSIAFFLSGPGIGNTEDPGAGGARTKLVGADPCACPVLEVGEYLFQLLTSNS
jgi:hypothetical protein